MGDRREEEDRRFLKLLTEAAERPRKSFKESMRETLESTMTWGYPPRTIYATAGVCYLCCDPMPEPPSEKELTLSDVVCDGCKKSGFWKEEP